ncbi:phytanoyl-CoA dioxygenase family protein [Nonomuraea turcica]|uniref:phytanoyl-CoA dioxygenase family protein n=1 Tax=Nonomuraea sp. G32 TaxID=3067274 RepID=UPI00273BADA3|nr:phytanoyl-CoA dioxygenase family protein [Nonomuraea sp. G32]MDP4503418.1 phytanoyl-CoA dioxygenase family protein [Nonomuraea sp. G32]
MVITEVDRILQDYDRDGYTIFRNVLDRDLVAGASDHVAWLQANHPDRLGEDLATELVAGDPFWVRLVSDDRLLDLAELFVGPDIALFAAHYISKPPFSGMPVLWHQDGAYWPLEPMRVVTLWLAVDESTPDNGCVRVIPGSHKEDLHALRQRDDIDNVLGSESAVTVDESRAVDLVLSPGDVEVHHPNILHASNANTSPRRRCGLTIRYIPTSTRITSEQQPFVSALLLRGDPGVNVYQPLPRYVEGEHMPFAGAEKWA